ncbi:Rpn family recombination-promoting nuclease/putative transposase [Limnofasciculus baicalensis]|uniref:Rpn family recombination-promoting nuclease/putative transposase n=1 Tax=Limnofasciculus baicalensis BBK-W-15 TaxID=2699891 RepID=A0AAE3KMT8_9CYAN|nr:Rpn family recombination-promoting nuclease/putative transposase [Limnofasciculus baicalensis]MCP2729136.1 Rpn family recombination-promoting nuclease/putative transposase [Limnofasciculus baicalensis BBK-W-15]
MNFINPKTDFAFKRIFGSEQNKDILISFLNGILYEGKSTIKNLEILNPYQAPKIRGVKDTYLDVKAVLDNEQTVIIEMQVLNVEGFEKRILYNEVANIATLNREELEELEQREMYLIDQRNAIKRADKQGEERGLRQKSLEIAAKLLDILDEASISQITGLSLEEVQRLKEER